MENGDFVIVFCATCLLLYVYYFFYIVILCCVFLTWCDVDVLLVGFGSAGSVCVLCCGGAEWSVLVLLHLGFGSCWFWDFDGDDFVVSWKTELFFCATCLLLFLYCDFCVDDCIRIIDFFVS